MKKTRNYLALALLSVFLMGASECGRKPTSDDIQRSQQETILKEGAAQIGMPAIKNFREKKILKMILELRDQSDFVTYSYVWSDIHACGRFLGESIGFGIPYATQFTNPQKIESSLSQGGYAILPQADPNGLFSPASAEGTWVMLKDPGGKDVKPIYVEPRLIVLPFKLTGDAVCTGSK